MDLKTLLYASTHEWVQVEGDVATIGISKFAVDQLTDLLMIELPKVGSEIQLGKSFGEVESVKAVSDLYAPLSGTVAEVNAAVAKDVQVLATDPYENGWLIKVKMADPGQLTALLTAEAYEAKVASEDH